MRAWRSVLVLAFVVGISVGFGAGFSVAPRPPPPAIGVAGYMDGLQKLDGHKIWESYAPDFQDQRIQEGDSEAATVALFDHLRQGNASIDEVTYLGGYQTTERGFFLYRTRHFRPNQEPIEVVWIFLTDPDGMVEMIY